MAVLDSSTRRWEKLQSILLLLIFLCFCLYLPTLFHYAFADDEIYLAYSNRFLREAPWQSLYKLFLMRTNPWEYLPLRDFTYWMDFRLFGDELTGFHASNLFWYAASGLASFLGFRELIVFCRPTWVKRASVLSLCGVLLFVAHPAHVEVAAWIASRKDLLAGTFSFLSVAMLVHAIRRDWHFFEIFLASLLFVAACFSKASAMTNILFFSVLIAAGWKNASHVSWVKKISALLLLWGLCSLIFFVHLKVGEATSIRIENYPGLVALIERASRILAAELGILFFPYPLHFYYDVYQIGGWHWLVSATAISVAIFSLLRLLIKGPSLWAFGVLWALVSLTVYLQFVPFTNWSLASERFVFLSVAGLALLLIEIVGGMDDPRLIGVLMLLIVLTSGPIVWFRVAEWEGNRSTLLQREYELQPDFHNVIRDRVVVTLLPGKEYEEASAISLKVPRKYARDVLISLISVERAYRKMTDAKSSAYSGTVDSDYTHDFCKAIDSLQSAVQNGYVHTYAESDISYNNILRTIDKQIKYRYADAKIICVAQ